MRHEIVIPRLGWSMEEGTFVGWLKKDGARVRPGEALFELEGEKATQEIEAVDEGTLHIPSNGPRPGAVLKVGAVIGYIATVGESLDQVDAPEAMDSNSIPTGDLFPSEAIATNASPVAAPSVRRLARELNVSISEVVGTGRGGRVLAEDIQRIGTRSPKPVPPNSVQVSNFKAATYLTGESNATIASPRARRIAAEMNIDWRRLSGSGAGGRVRECDVRAAQRSTNPGYSVSTTGNCIPLTSRRRVIAQRMVTSRQQTVPVTINSKADAANLVNLREQFKSVANLIVPSYQDIITKLVAETLKSHLLLAGRLDEDVVVLPGADELHIGIAVDAPDGLLVPVIPNCGQSTLTEIASLTRVLIEKARSGKLTSSEMQNGVFTITNLGAFGIDFFTPIINYPQAAILGIGAIRQTPTPLDNVQFAFKPEISLSLTFDHRMIDGAPAARFLQALGQAIANPTPWLCGV